MLRIERAVAARAEVRRLIATLDEVLSAAYPPENRHGLSLDAIFQPNMRLFRRLAG